MGYKEIKEELSKSDTTLLAVSKTKSVAQIMDLYNQGQRLFGENKVQELLEKKHQMPSDIDWHLIGHLQTNKVRSILPHVALIHGVDSFKLVKEISKEARKLDLIAPILLQIHIATEESKFGLDLEELYVIVEDYNKGLISNIEIQGLMGMASFTDETNQVKAEFKTLKDSFDSIKKVICNASKFSIVSMGMSGDYQIAIECGSTMVRIGSLLFGTR